MAMARAGSGRPESESCRDNANDETKLLSVSWNQDYSCFAAGTSHGFRVYTCDPVEEKIKREFKGAGGFGIVEMLFRSRVLALVGAKHNPMYPPNKVFIWDDNLGRFFVEYSYRSEIRSVKLRQDFLVVVLENKIHVHKLRTMSLLHQIETWANPKGLCSLSHHANKSVLACPGLRRGYVRVEHFSQNLTKLIKAHDSELSCLTLALDGLILATASTRGTLIRIFNTSDGSLLQEVRRGADAADIYSIALSPNLQWLAVSSDKGTVHVFSLRVGVVKVPSTDNQNAAADGQNAPISPPSGTITNPGSSLSFMKGVLPKYFSSEWSFAQFHLPESTQFIAAFGSQNTVTVAGMDGSFYRLSFDPVNGGEMVEQEFSHFLKAETKPMPR